ncbi:MAG TPA: hypothetical protein EYG15_01625 [Deltaproteobacteria bacterium]|nr:hypothetical protein [Candidatus Lambdaproteobacteria bacterium]HIL14797.1 hypothetical protein [Deltaproteobacteria bacterium]
MARRRVEIRTRLQTTNVQGGSRCGGCPPENAPTCHSPAESGRRLATGETPTAPTPLRRLPDSSALSPTSPAPKPSAPSGSPPTPAPPPHPSTPAFRSTVRGLFWKAWFPPKLSPVVRRLEPPC